VTHGSWVTWVMGQELNGSLGSWVTMSDPFDALALVNCPVCLVKAKFHYASWFEAGSKLVADRFEPASNQLA